MIKARLNLLVILLLMFITIQSNGQTISNVHSEQFGNTIEVHYTLNTTTPTEIALYVSLDGGTTWKGPLTKVLGDVGKNVVSGEHTIIWQVLEELEELSSDNIKFKVESVGKKPFEPEMVFVEGGTFMMGNNSDNSAKPVHKVTLSSFYIGKYEVTEGQWKEVMGNNRVKLSNCDDCPLLEVSYNDIQEYIKLLNERSGKQYRLPTEAEWEYAAIGGRFSKGYTYSGSNHLDTVGWYDKNSVFYRPNPVGKKLANELGIYDMSGNAWEWCSDWCWDYNTYTYPKRPQKNPTGLKSGKYHIVRGGSRSSSPEFCTIYSRVSSYLHTTSGFRLVHSTKDL
jgi:formylglycine-generating enzyme required for sulfatase activity